MSTTPAHRQISDGTNTLSPANIPVESLPVVELNVHQLRRAAALAYERNHSYTRIDGGDVYSSDSMMSHLIGIICEMAVASAYSADVDMQTYRFGDDGTDLDIWDTTVDVKGTATTAMRRPELLVKPYEYLSADLYFLAHIIEWGAESVRVRIHGYTDEETVTDREPRRHPGFDKNYVVEPSELTLPPWVRTD
ncbi:hypothetical protein [Halobellus salinisoli]|uniref:hypothetical protein n=1 Tax=Halobellus salinisoli TaxID=3108500 RepID=UPI00300A519F